MLLTKWVGKAWAEVPANKEMIQRTFRKCDISIPIDGSANDDINIKGLADYTVGEDEDEEGEELETDQDLDHPFQDMD